MSRRSHLLPVFLISTLALAACGRPTRPESHPANLVMICIDTVRFDTFHRIEATDPSDPLTPWANRAIRLERVQSTAPWTLPAVASVLTGLYPNRHGAGAFPNAIPDVARWIPTQIFENVSTLPELLRARGFQTAGFVAHQWYRQKFGLIRGFDEFEQGPDEKMVAGANAWLGDRSARADSRPFFLLVHLVDAHDYDLNKPPIAPALRDAAPSWGPAGICRNRDAVICERFLHYVESVARVRRSVAKLLEGLDRTGFLEDTIVVLYSDHGEEFHDHRSQEVGLPIHPKGVIGEGHGHAMFQELLHVPVLIWHPRIEARRVETPVSLVDLTPTIFEWMALEGDRDAWDGISLASHLAGGRAGSLQDRPLFSSANAYGPPRMVAVQGRWKRLVRQVPEQRLLFDLANDPLEQNPIRQDDRAALLDAPLAAYAEITSMTLGKARVPELDAEELKALQSLGYLQDVPDP
jgi:arylsulfatase A-like enzyme